MGFLLTIVLLLALISDLTILPILILLFYKKSHETYNTIAHGINSDKKPKEEGV